MNVENPIAFSFIMQDDIYLLNSDVALYGALAAAPATSGQIAKQEAPKVSAEVVAEVADPQPVIETPVGFNYSGNYKKGLLIIVYYTDVAFIAERHLTALESILTRLGFSLDDVAILNRANYVDAPFEHLAGFFKPQKMLLLGKDALPAGIEPLALNKPKQVNNCNTLFSFSFDEMMDNTEYKKAFWEQMKQL